MARVWLKVFETNDWPSTAVSELWWRDVNFEHAPDVGERIMFLASDEEPDGSTEIAVRNRYWSIDGTLNLELRRIVHLPDERMEETIRQGVALHSDGDYIRRIPMPWRQQDDEHGVLVDRLRRSGWRTWAELPEPPGSGT